MPGASLNKEWKLEPEYHGLYSEWQKAPTPQTNHAMLEAMTPMLKRYAQDYGGSQDPLTLSRARQLALGSLVDYDPKRAPLSVHMRQQMQGLRRQTRQATEVVKFPERQWFDAQAVRTAEQEMYDELGREPSEAEIANKLKFSKRRLEKARALRQPVTEGTLESIDAGLSDAVSGGGQPQARSYWMDLVYDELPPFDQKIMEHTLGMYGKKPMSNLQIASMLNRSPGYISQRKKLIQERLNRESDLSVYLP